MRIVFLRILTTRILGDNSVSLLSEKINKAKKIYLNIQLFKYSDETDQYRNIVMDLGCFGLENI